MEYRKPSPHQRVHVLQINPADNVAVAITALKSGHLESVDGVQLEVLQDVNLGAKLAIREIRSGEKIIKFGEPIGSASHDIRRGEYVHTHNLRSDYLPASRHNH